MIRVLLVDDEILVRVGLRQIIPWKQHGYEIVGEADSGEKALELFTQLQPDAVFTDVQMPGMDGLELVQKIKKLSPITPVCILSCHTEFNLVQVGIKYGIFDYIDKLNLTSNYIVDCLQRLRQQLEKGQDSVVSSNANNLALPIERSPLAWLEKYENEMIYEGPWVWMIMETKDLENHPWGVNSDYSKLIFAYPEAIQQGRIFLDMKNRIHCILALDAEDPLLVQSWSDRSEYSMAVSKKVHHRKDWIEAYQQADEAMIDLFYKGWNQVFEYEHRQHCSIQLDVLYKEQEEALLYHMRTKQREPLLQLFHEWLENSHRENIHPQRVKQSITILMFRMIKEVRWDEKQIQHWDDEIEQIREKRTKVEFIESIERLMDRMLEATEVSRYSPEVSTVLNYMDSNYGEKIILSTLAQQVHLNPNYLVRLFKEQMGKPPMHYLSVLRIEKAKGMLLDVEHSVQQVAENVGFVNVSHFSRLFKQITGIGPKEYRKVNNRT